MQAMEEQGVVPTPATHNMLIRSFVLCDRIEEAMQVFHTMEHPNRVTFMYLIQAAAKLDDVATADKLLRRLKETGERLNYALCKSYLEVVARVEGVSCLMKYRATILASPLGLLARRVGLLASRLALLHSRLGLLARRLTLLSCRLGLLASRLVGPSRLLLNSLKRNDKSNKNCGIPRLFARLACGRSFF